MKLLPECCSTKYVDNLAAKKWERECSCNQNWAKIQRKPEQECVRGSESEESEHESSSPLSRPLFKEFGRVHPRRGQPQRSGSRWKRWGLGAIGSGSADLWGRPAPGWAPWCPLRPGASSMVKFFENMVHGQKFARKDVQIIFPKGF